MERGGGGRSRGDEVGARRLEETRRRASDALGRRRLDRSVDLTHPSYLGRQARISGGWVYRKRREGRGAARVPRERERERARARERASEERKRRWRRRSFRRIQPKIPWPLAAMSCLMWHQHAEKVTQPSDDRKGWGLRPMTLPLSLFFPLLFLKKIKTCSFFRSIFPPSPLPPSFSSQVEERGRWDVRMSRAETNVLHRVLQAGANRGKTLVALGPL